MSADVPPKRALDFLEALGAGAALHYDASYLGHLVAVYRGLRGWGCAEDVGLAGLFHSIYGTERFHDLVLDVERRPEVVALIGERAERLAYVHCRMDRLSFDEALRGGGRRLSAYLSDETFELDERDFDDLGRVHLMDWLEQLPRARHWSYRRETYRRLAERFGGEALRLYERVYAALL